MGDPVTLESAPGVTAVLAAENQDAKSQPSNKNGKKADSSGSSFFTWFIVLALLGVWTSVAVVYFDLVDYQGVLGKLVAYDTDGDGDFDVEDAKVLLGLKEKDVVVTSRSPEAAAPVETTHPEATPEAAVEPDPVPVEDVIEAAVAEDTAAPSPPEPEAASESAPVAPPEADEVIEEEPEVLEEEPAAEEEDAAVEEEEVMCVCY
ncbi:aspartyl/asparaginyl beta-hydroxylase isoform X3 [Neolamprologus brichardi]|uniref:aspartyl/asparaginyl beta-hydroxylase isoform X3 n=1 Tax=Neolamprologus brichardi TaxID=32507 RepID=UPI0003EBDF7C|nr:aspartyl/asparaginyl beta-hydroxylase isoform X3 [Neolamprologus brichardi]